MGFWLSSGVGEGTGWEAALATEARANTPTVKTIMPNRDKQRTIPFSTSSAALHEVRPGAAMHTRRKEPGAAAWGGSTPAGLAAAGSSGVMPKPELYELYVAFSTEARTDQG